MANLALVGRDQPADDRHQPCGDCAPLGRRQGGMHLAAKGRLALELTLEPFDRAVDDADRRLVALSCGVAPGEQAVAFEHDAPRLWVLLAELFQPQPELETRPLPWQPADLAAEDL